MAGGAAPACGLDGGKHRVNPEIKAQRARGEPSGRAESRQGNGPGASSKPSRQASAAHPGLSRAFQAFHRPDRLKFLCATSPTLVVVNAKHPANSLKELIAIGKARAVELTYGSAGVGAATHLVGEYFANATGIKMLHVPYKGVQEAVSEVIGGRIDIAFPPIALALPYIRSGHLRALAITSSARVLQVREIPTVAEQGIADFNYSIWYGLVMSSKTPAPIIESLSQQMQRVSKMPEVIQQLSELGLLPQREVLREFDDYIAREVDKLGRIVKLSGATSQ
ncbi:tripartite tricarboxylate transporter substrate-binding protein [Ottowia sp.]|uniref:tripartite tricarboxylate transporter substrate-binding protein n=1 Tax=Ottowia sp. TaxID=1898956 RepID=UPI0025DB51EE|nr:tripartite tricarboxylate transporter substrate-binding protein [Ottowia sp.]